MKNYNTTSLPSFSSSSKSETGSLIHSKQNDIIKKHSWSNYPKSYSWLESVPISTTVTSLIYHQWALLYGNAYLVQLAGKYWIVFLRLIQLLYGNTAHSKNQKWPTLPNWMPFTTHFPRIKKTSGNPDLSARKNLCNSMISINKKKRSSDNYRRN